MALTLKQLKTVLVPLEEKLKVLTNQNDLLVEQLTQVREMVLNINGKIDLLDQNGVVEQKETKKSKKPQKKPVGKKTKQEESYLDDSDSEGDKPPVKKSPPKARDPNKQQYFNMMFHKDNDYFTRFKGA